MAKQVAHQETTNSINDGHWRRKITKNCWQEIKVNRNNNDGEKKIIEKHCSKRFNKDLSTRQRDREEYATQITIKKRTLKEKSGTKRKRNLLQFIKFIRRIEKEKKKELCKKDERRSKLKREILKVEIAIEELRKIYRRRIDKSKTNNARERRKMLMKKIKRNLLARHRDRENNRRPKE